MLAKNRAKQLAQGWLQMVGEIKKVGRLPGGGGTCASSERNANKRMSPASWLHKD